MLIICDYFGGYFFVVLFKVCFLCFLSFIFWYDDLIVLLITKVSFLYWQKGDFLFKLGFVWCSCVCLFCVVL